MIRQKDHRPGLSPRKITFAIFISVASAVVLSRAPAFLLSHLFSGCDLHYQDSSLSPDGLWRVIWELDGCHGFLLSEYFYQKVSVLNTRSIDANPHIVFESDGEDKPIFTWPMRDELQIEIPSIRYITRSERGFSGISIQYAVQKSTLRELDQLQNAYNLKITTLPESRLSLEDRRSAESINEQYRNYLSHFKKWSQDFSLTGTHP